MNNPGPRNILLITTDQQRFEALGCNGGQIARTPVADKLASEGLNYKNARNNNVVCMPSRVSLLTGQYPHTHGVVANGIPYQEKDGTSLPHWLKQRAGYQTALLGKAHFEPGIDPLQRYRENQLAAEGSTGPWLGFDHVELALHGPLTTDHYSRFILDKHPQMAGGFAAVLMGQGGGDTGAPEVAHNPIPREFYHTDWVASRTMAYLDSLDGRDPFFVWMSFPDPHHPFDPPLGEIHRVNWRDLDLPPGHPGPPEKIEAVLSQKPAHWLAWYQGRFHNPEGGPNSFRPGQLTADQLREMSAMIHIQNELIDEATGGVLAHLAQKGWLDNTDVFFTTDHGDLQGDFGLFFKGPYLVEGLMHLPFIWRPAKSAKVKPAVIQAPVSHIDFFPTACQVAGVPVPHWAQGEALPTSPKESRSFSINTWDSQFRAVGMHLRNIYHQGWVLTAYLPSTQDQGGRFPVMEALWGSKGVISRYKGGEGELYDLSEDPHQWRNLWNDASAMAMKKELLSLLKENLPPVRMPPLKVAAPT